MDAFSYTGHRKSRQTGALVRGAAIALLALQLGGCAVASLPFAEMSADRTARSDSANPAVVPVSATAAVDPSDWETVRRTLARAPGDAIAEPLYWSNPDTGSTGSVAGLGGIVDRSGLTCRPFATTVSDSRGVRRYRGDACQRADGRWQLYGVTPDDAELS